MLGGLTPPVNYRQQYDVTHDGQRFLVNMPIEHEAASPIDILINWTAALKK